jgi:hypothetical protein
MTHDRPQTTNPGASGAYDYVLPGPAVRGRIEYGAEVIDWTRTLQPPKYADIVAVAGPAIGQRHRARGTQLKKVRGQDVSSAFDARRK